MSEFTINLPEELEQIIIDEGHTTKSWIETQAIKPLKDRLKRNLENKEIKKAEKKIEKLVKATNEKIKIIKKRVVKKKKKPTKEQKTKVK